jgi:hypothetical protein
MMRNDNIGGNCGCPLSAAVVGYGGALDKDHHHPCRWTTAIATALSAVYGSGDGRPPHDNCRHDCSGLGGGGCNHDNKDNRFSRNHKGERWGAVRDDDARASSIGISGIGGGGGQQTGRGAQHQSHGIGIQ